MKPHRNAHTSTLALIAVSTLTLLGVVGCAPEDSGTSTPASASSESDAKNNVNDDADALEDAPVEEIAATECLLGEWSFPMSELQSYYDTIAEDMAEFTVSGDVMFTLDGDAYAFDTDLVLEIDMGVSAEGHLIGPVGGSYTATEETITTSQEYSDASLDINVMGQTIDGTSQFEGFLSMFSMIDTPYECSGDSLTLHYEKADKDRMPLTLNRLS